MHYARRRPGSQRRRDISMRETLMSRPVRTGASFRALSIGWPYAAATPRASSTGTQGSPTASATGRYVT